MKQIKRLLVILVVFYLIALTFVYVKQRSFIYFPENTPPPDGFVTSLGLEAVDVFVSEIGDIRSFYSPPPKYAPTILFFHGNGGSVYHRSAILRAFKSWGVGFLAVEYPGYAGNPGMPSQETFFASATAHYDWLISRGIQPQNIALYGHSLGAASAVHVASEGKGSALILSAPFTSAVAMGQRRMPYFPAGLLLKDKFRSDKKIPEISMPIIIYHGRKDRVIPWSMGRELASLSSSSEFYSIEEGTHNNLWNTKMQESMGVAVWQFATEHWP